MQFGTIISDRWGKKSWIFVVVVEKRPKTYPPADAKHRIEQLWPYLMGGEHLLPPYDAPVHVRPQGSLREQTWGILTTKKMVCQIPLYGAQHVLSESPGSPTGTNTDWCITIQIVGSMASSGFEYNCHQTT
jgi:hypothetical protein